MIDFSIVKSIIIPQGSVESVSTGGLSLWTLVKPDSLPNGYTKLLYIETDGNSWIDTGVNASNYSEGIRYMFSGNATSYRNSANYLFGAGVNNCRSGNLSIDCSKLTNYPCRFIVGGTPSFRKGIREHIYPLVGEDFIINAFANANLPDNTELTLIVNDNTYESSFSSTSTSSAMPDANIYLFWVNGTTSASQYYGKCYSFTMEAADGTPIRNFVPAKRNSDDVVGLYDTVTKTFFTNAGTGSFVAGTEAQ